MDAKLLKDRIEGLTQRIGQLRASEAIMLQAQGLDHQVNKAKKEIQKIQVSIQATKEALTELQGMQAHIVNDAMDAFCARINEALPDGKAVFSSENGDQIFLGWKIDGVMRPFKALSGGERVAFEIALARALGAEVLIKEVAELDRKRLEVVLEKLGSLELQAVLVTCHAPTEIPGPWMVVAP